LFVVKPFALIPSRYIISDYTEQRLPGTIAITAPEKLNSVVDDSGC
jgi:hypothetical protein